jgi:Zn finger protein HypA/HybF involved in hydrogenase expression
MTKTINKPSEREETLSKPHRTESLVTQRAIKSPVEEREFYCLSCGEEFTPLIDEMLCERCSKQENSDLLHWR